MSTNLHPKDFNTAYRKGGLDAVWALAKAHGEEGWRVAEEWARKRAKREQGALRSKLRKAARIYGHRLHHAIVLRKRHAKRAKKPLTMLDSVDASALDPNAEAAACYADGRYSNCAAVRARCPHAKLVPITVLGRDRVKAGDVEPGDMTLIAGVAWAGREVAAGRRPMPYASVSQWGALARGLAARLGVSVADVPKHVDPWSAHYTDREHLCSPSCGFGMPFTAAATQYHGSMVASNPDVSVVERSVFS